MADIVQRLEDWLAPSNEPRDSELYGLVLEAAGVISSLRRQRNAQTFALQCFHSHAMKNGDDATAITIAEYLTAAGWPLEPEHWRIATADRDPGPSCETCGGIGYVVVGQTHDWPYGEQIQCPDCAEVCETCGGGGEVPGPITETGLWHKNPCPVCRPDEGAE